MIERVAKKACCPNGCMYSDPCLATEDDARIVINAMREPTDEMLKAGVEAFRAAYNSDDTLADWRACYRAMIDSALSKREEG